MAPRQHKRLFEQQRRRSGSMPEHAKVLEHASKTAVISAAACVVFAAFGSGFFEGVGFTEQIAPVFIDLMVPVLFLAVALMPFRPGFGAW